MVEEAQLKTYRATVWTLSAVANASDMQRRIVTEKAESPEAFEGLVRDRFTWHLNDIVEFGPVSEVPE